MAFKQHVFKNTLESLQRKIYCFLLPHETKANPQPNQTSWSTKILCCTHQISAEVFASQPYTFLNPFSMPGYWNQWMQYSWMVDQTTSSQTNGLSLVTPSRIRTERSISVLVLLIHIQSILELDLEQATSVEWQRCSVFSSPQSMIF